MSGITRYIFRQLALGTALVSVALAFVVWLTQSLQFLQFIINKGLAINAWLKLTMLLLPWFLQVILPAALFLVTVFIYNKLTVDRELVVVQAAGVSRLGLAHPALISAAAFSGASGGICISVLIRLLPCSWTVLDSRLRGNDEGAGHLPHPFIWLMSSTAIVPRPRK